jgi:hypothetical protein
MRMRYPSAAAGKRRRAGGTADHWFTMQHPTTLAVPSMDRDTDGGPRRARSSARYCFHDSL